MSFFARGALDLYNRLSLDGKPLEINRADNLQFKNDKEIFVTSFSQLCEQIEESKGKPISFRDTSQIVGNLFDIDGGRFFGSKFSQFRSLNATKVRLSNFSAQKIELRGADIILENISSFDLKILPGSGSVRMSNCTIGTLSIDVSSGDVVIENSNVLTLRTPRELKMRDFILKGVVFSLKTEREFQIDPDLRLELPKLERTSFGFLHDWAQKTGNSEVAHLARGHELAIERRLAQSFFERFVLASWGLFANYGLSPLKPIIWMVVALFFMAVTIFLTDSSLALPESQIVGWRTILLDDPNQEGKGSIYRAFAGAMEGTVSPLSVLSPRRMIVPNSSAVASIQVLYGYFCLAMVLLFGFSIRRRFKV